MTESGKVTDENSPLGPRISLKDCQYPAPAKESSFNGIRLWSPRALLKTIAIPVIPSIKDTWTKSRGRELGLAGVGWRDEEKRHTTVIE